MTLLQRLKSLKRSVFNTYPYRPYFNRHRCLFIHIPKSAGTSILNALSDGRRIYRDHAGWFEYYRHDPHRFNAYFTFTVVRNPFDRLASTYHYLEQGGNGQKDLAYAQMFRESGMTFETFVMNYLDEDRIHEILLLRPQYLFLYDEHRRLMVDQVARFETLENDFASIARRLGLDADALKQTNASVRSRDLQTLYANPAMIDKVVRLYRNDFELLAYEPKL